MAGRGKVKLHIKITTAVLRHEPIYSYMLIKNILYCKVCRQILFTPFVVIKEIRKQKLNFLRIYSHIVCMLSEGIIHECKLTLVSVDSKNIKFEVLIVIRVNCSLLDQSATHFVE